MPRTHGSITNTVPERRGAGPEAESGHPVAGGVVVGYDGTWHSMPALRRAAIEAVGRETSLTVLHVVQAPTDPELDDRGLIAEALSGWERSTSQVTAAVDDLRLGFPSLSVTFSAVLDRELAQAQAQLATAGLLVLGDAGTVGPRAFLLGSTSRGLVRYTSCPILVVPDGGRTTHEEAAAANPGEATVVIGAVVVGVGRGPAVLGLLTVAGWEAKRRGHRLCVVHSYHTAAGDGGAPHPAVQRQVHRSVAAASLDPSVLVTTILTPEPATEALLRLGHTAELLVIGSRGPLAMAPPALGSVSRGVLDRTGAPVLVVPHAVAEALPRRGHATAAAG